MTLHPGSCFQIEVNQGKREAMVLAVDGDLMLIEYEMPNGTTALRICDQRTDGARDRSVSYRALSKRWLRLIVEEGRDWIGQPQSGPTVPSAATLLMEGRPR